MTIGFIGNHSVSYSTEQDRVWSFRKLNHEVIEFQENETTAQQLIEAASKLDMLVYSHTHDPSYVIVGLKDVFAKYKELNIPTVSVHLDRWAGLERVKDVGQEATWFTEYIFMADGSPEAAELYNKLGLNWYYLPPGVKERDCYIIAPNYDKYPHEIVFTGSKGYHPEYPFRAQLIDWLHETYGDRFGHYGNDGIKVLREHQLNVMLASSKIVIGDSCFGGRPNYTSDRITEVVGRGGFIITPDVETLGIPVATYKHPDLDDLKSKIDYYLTHDSEREDIRRKAHEHVKNNDTYTQRSQTIIDTVFNND